MPKKRKGDMRISPRMQKFLDGKIAIEELDDEEIKRGQLRAADGTFRGRPQDAVPRKFYEAMRSELIKRWELKVQETLDPSLQALKEIATGNHRSKTPADARMKAAIYLIERTVGKVPDKVEAKVEVAKWEEDIADLLYEADDEDEASD